MSSDSLRRISAAWRSLQEPLSVSMMIFELKKSVQNRSQRQIDKSLRIESLSD